MSGCKRGAITNPSDRIFSFFSDSGLIASMAFVLNDKCLTHTSASNEDGHSMQKCSLAVGQNVQTGVHFANRGQLAHQRNLHAKIRC